jgi:DNA-binding response OmpR family regulator
MRQGVAHFMTSSSQVAAGDRSQISPARVLVAMDRPTVVKVIELALKHGQFETRSVKDTAQADALLGRWQPHLALIDVDLEQGKLLDSAIASGRTPIIALTRRGDLKTKLAAFDRGVDDILSIPFSPEELVARTLALMRRTYGRPAMLAPVIRFGELEIDLLRRSVRAGTSELHLTSLEQSLLYVLAANAGNLVTREELLDALWGADYISESNVIDRHVRNLRAKLQDDPRRPRYIATVTGRGYRFVQTSSA